MAFPIALFQDDFAAATPSPAWALSLTGSATMSQGGGVLTIVLPSSTAGSHQGTYFSNASYDLTGGSFYWNIGTMVSTAVAATAYFQLLLEQAGTNQLLWRQVSNAITARTIIAGVDTQRYTATWSATTYKYLRIREAAGTVYWDSSTNGTTWTNRFSMANPFAVTSLYVQFAAACGNVASPGSLRVDGVNLILPTPSSTWRETTADWGIGNRLRSVTLASDGGKQGVLVTADTLTESSRALGGTVRYFAGPLGSSSGGYLQATEYASLALAQASAFTIPIDGRVDLSAQVDARYMRLYHRSTDASSHTIYEYMPRRLVQADDIEAESIRAINIAANAITADKIFVLDLSAITATIGQLTIASSAGLNAWIYQGTGTGDSPTTGLKLFNSGGIGKLSTYNATVEQITLDTDGVLKAGAGKVELDASGIGVIATSAWADANSYRMIDASGAALGGFGGEDDPGDTYHQLTVRANAITNHASRVRLESNSVSARAATLTAIVNNASGGIGSIVINAAASAATATIAITALTTSMTGGLDVGTASGGINVGSATGATAGQISTSAGVGFGAAAQSNIRLYAKGQDATSSNYAFYIQDSAATVLSYIRNDGAVVINKSGSTVGFYGSGGTTKPTVTGTKTATAGVAVPALTSLLTALANLGILTDSST